MKFINTYHRLFATFSIFLACFFLLSCEPKIEQSSQAKGLVEVSPSESAQMAARDGVVPLRSDLRLMRYALLFVNARYVEPKRIDWQKMTVQAIDALQNLVPQAVARFNARIDANPSSVDLRVNAESLTIDLSKIDSLAAAHTASVEAINFVIDKADEKQDERELEYAMINGMFSTLDPHTNLLPPAVLEDLMLDQSGFAGVGFVVGVRDEQLMVISPMEGAPAWRAGIKAGDRVLRIDDESTENMPLQDAVDRMRGEAGTKVTLYILRRGWTETKPFVITREKIRVESVTSHAIKKDKVGYIKLKSFDQTTGKDLLEHLDKLKKDLPQMAGLIIDLRNNSGGLLSQSIAVTEPFLEKDKTIVIVEGEAGSGRELAKTRRTGSELGYPIVVLINEGSASASEIVSGALQFHDRAVIVGERSFGKGSVQIVKENADGSAIKMTSAQYLTPGDISIQGVGIVPDIRFMPTIIDKESGISLIERSNVHREESLDKSLHSEKTIERESLESLYYLYEPPKEAEERAKALGLTTYDLKSTEAYMPDGVSDFAIALIKAAGSPKRSKFLKESKPFFADYDKQYQAKVKQALEKLGLDWSGQEDADSCQDFSWGLQFAGQDYGPNDKINFEANAEKVKLELWVQNDCDTKDVTRLLGILTSNNGIFDQREFAFGRIKPGKRRQWSVELKVPQSMLAREDIVKVQFYASLNALGKLDKTSKVGQFTAAILPREKPRFAYQYWLDDASAGNADGLLSRGESLKLYIWVKNVGTADAGRVQVNVANESGSGILLQQATASIETLPIGESKLVAISFDLSKELPKNPPSKRLKPNKPFDPKKASLSLGIADTENNVRLTQALSFNVDGPKFDLKDRVTGLGNLKIDAKILAQPKVDARVLAQNVESQTLSLLSLNDAFSAICWEEDGLKPCAYVANKDVEQVLEADKAKKRRSAKTSKKTAKPTKPLLAVNFAKEAPIVSFGERAYSETSPLAKVVATISDNDGLSAYEAYVWTYDGMRLQAEKLDYERIEGLEKSVLIDVPLKVGDNSLILVVRDQTGIEVVESRHINRIE